MKRGKKNVLLVIEREGGRATALQIAKKLHTNQGMVEQYLRELRADGRLAGGNASGRGRPPLWVLPRLATPTPPQMQEQDTTMASAT